MTELEIHISDAQNCFNTLQYAQAIEHCHKAIKIEPANANAHLIAGLACYSINAHSKCITHFEQCMSEVKKTPHYQEKYAIALSLNNRVSEAVQQFENIVTNHPEYSQVWFNYGYLLSDGRVANYQKAIEYFDTAEQNPNHPPQLYFYRGTNYYNLKKNVQATMDLEKALELEPANAEAAFLLGEINTRQTDYQTAIDYYSRALYYNSAHPKAIEQRLIARVNNKDANGNIINQQAAQHDVDTLMEADKRGEKPFFMSLTSKEGKPLKIKKATVSEKGELNYVVE